MLDSRFGTDPPLQRTQGGLCVAVINKAVIVAPCANYYVDAGV